MAAALSDTTPMLLLFPETWFQELPKHLPAQCYYTPLQHSVSFNSFCKHVCVCVVNIQFLLQWGRGMEKVLYLC